MRWPVLQESVVVHSGGVTPAESRVVTGLLGQNGQIVDVEVNGAIVVRDAAGAIQNVHA